MRKTLKILCRWIFPFLKQLHCFFSKCPLSIYTDIYIYWYIYKAIKSNLSLMLTKTINQQCWPKVIFYQWWPKVIYHKWCPNVKHLYVQWWSKVIFHQWWHKVIYHQCWPKVIYHQWWQEVTSRQWWPNVEYITKGDLK